MQKRYCYLLKELHFQGTFLYFLDTPSPQYKQHNQLNTYLRSLQASHEQASEGVVPSPDEVIVCVPRASLPAPLASGWELPSDEWRRKSWLCFKNRIQQTSYVWYQMSIDLLKNAL